METKALYNSLRMRSHAGLSSWQVTNYRQKEISTLFDEQKAFGLDLDERRFLAFAQNCSEPEELFEILVPEGLNSEQEDHLFLLIFELWRRLVPEGRSLSILSDELDEQIYLHDRGSLASEEMLQDALANLLVLLEENLDAGTPAPALISLVQQNLAHDLESFLYDFITEKIEEKNTLYASELLEGFLPFMSDLKWFDLLEAKLDLPHAKELMEEVIQEISEIEFALECLEFLAYFADPTLFSLVFKKTLPLISKEDELQEVLSITASYFCSLDQESAEKRMLQFLEERKDIPLKRAVSLQDPLLENLKRLKF